MSGKFRGAFLALGALAGVWFAALPAAAQTGAEKPASGPTELKYYELRTYHAAPGKLAEVKQEFTDWIIPGLLKVGMHPIGYWVTEGAAPGDGAVVYLVGFKDKAERDAAWAQFRTDPDVEKGRAATNAKIAASGGVRFIAKADIVLMTMAEFSPHATTEAGVPLR